MNLSSLRLEVRLAVQAAREKHAEGVTILKLPGTGAFAEYFLLCSGQSQPQLRAIGEAVEERLERAGYKLSHREGKAGAAEWLLLDYGNFIVHIFSERAREYYDLERLWRNAERLDLVEGDHPQHDQPEAESNSAHE